MKRENRRILVLIVALLCLLSVAGLYLSFLTEEKRLISRAFEAKHRIHIDYEPSTLDRFSDRFFETPKSWSDELFAVQRELIAKGYFTIEEVELGEEQLKGSTFESIWNELWQDASDTQPITIYSHGPGYSVRLGRDTDTVVLIGPPEEVNKKAKQLKKLIKKHSSRDN